MSMREKVSADALSVALQHKRCGLGISMGVGKTLIGLRYLESYHQQITKRILVVAPKLSIFQTWKDEAVKFNINPRVMELIDFTTYLSLTKCDPNQYDIVVLDECHSLLFSHEKFLGAYTGRVLGLTGTPPRYERSEKGQMVFKHCPIMFKYITDEAVDANILNDYRIIVHKLELSTTSNFLVETKKGRFYTSEAKNYGYWSERIAKATTKKEEQITSIMRMKAMMEYRTKEVYAKKLLSEIEDKCIVFCNTQAQADRICTHSVHSNNIDADENLEKFKRDQIEQLSCVLQLNEGVNIPNLRAGIILHAYGNERKASQRIGRLLRLNPDDLSTVHILSYINTIDDNRWVPAALKDFDETKIKYFNVKESLV